MRPKGTPHYDLLVLKKVCSQPNILHDHCHVDKYPTCVKLNYVSCSMFIISMPWVWANYTTQVNTTVQGDKTKALWNTGSANVNKHHVYATYQILFDLDLLLGVLQKALLPVVGVTGLTLVRSS